jgi:hypothetical protein
MSGVFGLGEVRTEQIDRTWSESANYGYFAGGFTNPNSYRCTLDRLDFSNETVSLPGPSLTRSARYLLAAVSSSNYGYFAGGAGHPTATPPAEQCIIDRLDFSSETVEVPSVGDQLSYRRAGLAAVSNSNYGYFGGGYSPAFSPVYTCIIERIDFSSETVAAPPVGNQLTQARVRSAAVSNSNYGYFAGGVNSGGGNICTIDRLDFSNETVVGPSVHGANLTRARGNLAGVFNSNYGYFAGGQAPGLAVVCTIDRIDFSNETVSAPGNQLTERRYGVATVSNSNYGYFGGGHTSPSDVCTIDRIDFSNETVAVPPVGNQSTQARNSAAGVSGGKSINARGVRKGTDKDGKGISSTYGYFAGGFDPSSSPSVLCTIDRIDYSSETVAVPPVGKQLTEARYSLAAVSNSNYAYFAGGTAPGFVCTIDRIDFSNETVAVPPVGNELTASRSEIGAVSNSNYGYFAGGASTPYTCIIDRLDFSSETILIPASTPQLTGLKTGLAGLSNSNYGYFGGGFYGGSYFCTIDRIDFSTETVDGPPVHGASLTQARTYVGAVSNSNYGYFAGGSPGRVCTIDRIDFSNDTVDGPPVHGASLTQNRSNLAGVFNSNYGYLGGGFFPSVATIDRIDFSTETVDGPAVHGANLTQARTSLAGVSN